MKFIKIIFLASLLAFMSFSNRTAVDGCSILHRGTFEYMTEKYKVKVVIDSTSHIEYHNGGKYIIQSKLVWVSDCEYNATIEKVTVPDFPFRVGQSMNVKVMKIEGKTIHYMGRINENIWPGELKKIK